MTDKALEAALPGEAEVVGLMRRLRDYRPPSADPEQPREHHPICDEAADTLQAMQARAKEGK